jgi:hypothetical protein
VADDPRTSKVAVIGGIILDGVENYRETGKLAPDGDHGLDAIHFTIQLDIHQRDNGWRVWRISIRARFCVGFQAVL